MSGYCQCKLIKHTHLCDFNIKLIADLCIFFLKNLDKYATMQYNRSKHKYTVAKMTASQKLQFNAIISMITALLVSVYQAQTTEFHERND